MKATQNGSNPSTQEPEGIWHRDRRGPDPAKQRTAGPGQQTQGSQEHLDQERQELRSTGRQEGCQDREGGPVQTAP